MVCDTNDCKHSSKYGIRFTFDICDATAIQKHEECDFVSSIVIMSNG